MKLDNRKTIAVGFAFLAISAFWQLYDNIVPLILKYFFNIGDTLAGGIMALDNVFALILLPVFGAWSDRVNSRMGKRTPFILVGTVLSVVFMLLLPAAANRRSLTMFITVLLATLISMSIYRSPAVSLMPDVTPKPLRSKGNAIINLMGAIGVIMTLGFIMLFVGEGKTPDYEPVFISIAVVMTAALLIIIFMVDENKMRAERIETERKWGVEEADDENADSSFGLTAPVKKSLVFLLLSVAFWYMAYNAVTTAFSRYAIQMWGMEGGSFAGALMVASAGALVSFIPVGILSGKFGRKKVILFGVILLGASFFTGTLFVHPNFAVNIVFFLVGVAWASINVNSYPMVVEMCRGSDIGKFTGMYYTFSMAAQVLTPILSGWFLEHIGYRTLFPYAFTFCVLAFLTMLGVKHGDNKPLQNKGKLESFDVGD